ncbi:MAG TPA: XRE family transcriptional regulator [Planctomycetaceae bacterium]|nr:XRE family transcriptional regulator [Planctomycetaceae bacterium]
MASRTARHIRCKRIELDGIRYVILRESVFDRLCEKAGVQWAGADGGASGAMEWDGKSLAEKLVRRRRACGLSQAALARLAGIRPETLNRIERGHTTPDFRTVRKLVAAMNAAEWEQASKSIDAPPAGADNSTG